MAEWAIFLALIGCGFCIYQILKQATEQLIHIRQALWELNGRDKMRAEREARDRLDDGDGETSVPRMGDEELGAAIANFSGALSGKDSAAKP